MVKKYRVTQKIKAFGLQVGDMFKCDDTGYCFREYGNGETIECPAYLLKDHPDWFTPLPEVESEDKIEELEFDDDRVSQFEIDLAEKLNEIIRRLNKRRTI